MAVLEQHPVRPRPGKLILLVLGCLAFVAVGVVLILSGGVVRIAVGVLSIVLFGGFLIIFLVNITRRGLTQLVLSPDGIRLRSGGTIPWRDVEAVDLIKHHNTMVAVVLRSPDRYLASIPPGGTRESNVTRSFLKPFAHLLRFIPSLRRYADNVHDHAGELRWNRDVYGFDIGLSPLLLDRPAGEFVELLERYRQRFSGAG